MTSLAIAIVTAGLFGSGIARDVVGDRLAVTARGPTPSPHVQGAIRLRGSQLRFAEPSGRPSLSISRASGGRGKTAWWSGRGHYRTLGVARHADRRVCAAEVDAPQRDFCQLLRDGWGGCGNGTGRSMLLVVAYALCRVGFATASRWLRRAVIPGCGLVRVAGSQLAAPWFRVASRACVALRLHTLYHRRTVSSLVVLTSHARQPPASRRSGDGPTATASSTFPRSRLPLSRNALHEQRRSRRRRRLARQRRLPSPAHSGSGAPMTCAAKTLVCSRLSSVYEIVSAAGCPILQVSRK